MKISKSFTSERSYYYVITSERSYYYAIIKIINHLEDEIILKSNL